jgi:hypothetical protein
MPRSSPGSGRRPLRDRCQIEPREPLIHRHTAPDGCDRAGRATNGVWGATYDLGGQYVRVSATARDGVVDLFLDGYQPPGGLWRRFDGAWSDLFEV